MSVLEAIVRLLELLVKPVTAVITRWQTRQQERALKGQNDTFKALNTITSQVDGVYRAVLLRSENGGGIPRPGSPLYVRAVASARAEHANDVEGWDDRRRVDSWYIRFIFELCQKGEQHIRTDQLPEDGVLRGVYERDGIVASHVLRIGYAQGGLFYLSINMKNDMPLRPDQRAIVAEQRDKLTNVLGARPTPHKAARMNPGFWGVGLALGCAACIPVGDVAPQPTQQEIAAQEDIAALVAAGYLSSSSSTILADSRR